jgi:hypothetical protein
VSKQDATRIIVDSAKKVLSDVQRRSTEALKALEQDDYLVALGGLFGLEEQVRSINVRLLVLREIKEIQKTKSKERRKP